MLRENTVNVTGWLMENLREQQRRPLMRFVLTQGDEKLPRATPKSSTRTLLPTTVAGACHYLGLHAGLFPWPDTSVTKVGGYDAKVMLSRA